VEEEPPCPPGGAAPLAGVLDALVPPVHVALTAQCHRDSGPPARLEEPHHARPPDGEESQAEAGREAAVDHDREADRRAEEHHDAEYEPAHALARTEVDGAGRGVIGHVSGPISYGVTGQVAFTLLPSRLEYIRRPRRRLPPLPVEGSRPQTA